MFYIHSQFGVLFTAGKCSSMWRFIPKGMCYYTEVCGRCWSTYTPMSLLRVPGADQNLTPETYTPHQDSIMCQLHGNVCMEWTFVLSGTGETRVSSTKISLEGKLWVSEASLPLTTPISANTPTFHIHNRWSPRPQACCRAS